MNEAIQSVDNKKIPNSQWPHRVRKRPTWISDYKITKTNQFDDLLTHLALFSDYDPIVFKDVVKETKW